MIEAAQDGAFAALLEKIARERGFGCASYKEKCLRRRIAVRMRARGVHTYGDYGRLLDGDAVEWERLLDALTINVTKFFRNPDTFHAIARAVIPILWERHEPRLRIWSAGCASGEEPYSLAALFHRHAVAVSEPWRLDRVEILGTDIDRTSLAAAARGEYAEAAFADTPPLVRERYFTRSGGVHAVVPELRRMVRTERRDLLVDAAPPGPVHLITCRNVIIYFDRATQEALFQRFAEALAPGGFLVLGKVETLLGAARSAFVPVEPRERIFRRQ